MSRPPLLFKEGNLARKKPELRHASSNFTSGTMDNGYMNNAVYQVEDFFKKTQHPPADAEIIYGERREHCFTGDTENPNNVGSRTVHQRYMPAMTKRVIKTAPKGADTKSWVY